MKIVFLDGEMFTDCDTEKFNELGEFEIYKYTNHENERERIGDAEIVLINSTAVRPENLKDSNVKYIGLLATGYNWIPYEEYQKLGIIVTNTPKYSTEAIAQNAFLHILNILSQYYDQVKDIRENGWTELKQYKKWFHSADLLNHKTVGILGYGAIGKKLHEYLKPFNINLMALDRHNENSPSLDEILEKSDIISLNMPLTDENKNIINRETIKKMKDGVIIINTARGGLIDEEALYEGLKSKKIRAVGLDVMAKEPPEKDNPLLKLENVYITPHSAWAARRSRQNMLDIGYNNIKSYIDGKIVNSL
ncbi:MAG: NAD(P)-dependent oxidoreductase [Tissierellia bacterium]|nr:NAD(P)-dependent oxidoreductase [Tissierellia bacterium]